MKTVALETSSQPGSLALLEARRVLYTTPLAVQRRTTESFAVQLRDALSSVGWRPSDVELFAVCEGPGSFTGLRIGVTAAKTFAYATGCRLAALNTLEVVAAQAGPGPAPVWSVLDAQRQQLFVAQFDFSAHQLREITPTTIVDARPWITQLPSGIRITGRGLRKWQALLPNYVDKVPEANWELQASRLGQLAMDRVERGQTDNLWKLVPRYYRQSAAEEKLQQRATNLELPSSVSEQS